jgi:hypothetical protein
MAGLLAHASEITYFLAPYINSYKRFMAGTFAPTGRSGASTTALPAIGCAAPTARQSGSNAGSAALTSIPISLLRR